MQLADVEHGVPANPPFNKSYDNFFRIIANTAQDFTPRAPRLPDDPSIRDQDTAFVAQTLGVLIVAEDSDAMGAVAQCLETQYLRMGNRLWTYVQEKYSVWMNIGVRIQSPIIFREAIIHMIGQIDCLMVTIKPTAFEGKGEVFITIRDLIQKKIDQLKALKKKSEQELLQFFPIKMYHPHTENGYNPDRTVYSSDIYLYQARSIWIQYISCAYQKDLHHRADDGGIRLYRTIITGGKAYLEPASLESYTQRFAMSPRALGLLHQAIDEIKEESKGVLKELLRDNTQGQMNDKAQLGYLTCTWIEDSELPF